MTANRLRPGDVIGFPSPSAIACEEDYAPIFRAAERLGYRVRPGKNLYAHGWGYAASDVERAEDINRLILDDEVSMLFFSGGEGADEVIPLIDYEAAARHPKLYLSYSDGTSILNAIHTRTGLTVYYGQTPGDLASGNAYTLHQFHSHMVAGNVTRHTPNSPWRTLTPGVARGELTGGYLDNYVFLAHSGWVRPEPGKKYILFIEEHEKFFQMPHVSDELGRLEQSPIMKQAVGLLFGHYSDPVSEPLMQRLTLLGQRHGIPVVYCDDFGHGENHAILPLGAQAELNATAKVLTYL